MRLHRRLIGGQRGVGRGVALGGARRRVTGAGRRAPARARRAATIRASGATAARREMRKIGNPSARLRMRRGVAAACGRAQVRWLANAAHGHMNGIMDVQTTAAAAPRVTRREDYRPPDWLVPDDRARFRPRSRRAPASRATLTRRAQRRARPAAAARRRRARRRCRSRVDGVAVNDWRIEGEQLVIPLAGDAHAIETEVEIAPERNTQLMGLYASGGNLCTQCEAEGFRRITFFPDRPDVLSALFGADDRRQGALSRCCWPTAIRSRTGDARRRPPLGRMERSLPQALLPVRAGRGRSRRQSRHASRRVSGREVQLGIWVRAADLRQDRPRARTRSKPSMAWDERRLWPRIRSRRVQHRRGRRFQLRRDGEQGAEHLQQPLHPRRSRHRDRLRLRRDRRGRRARIFPQLVGQPRHLPRLVPAVAEGRLHRLPRPGLLRRPGHRPRSSGSRTSAGLRAAQFPEDAGPLAHPVRPDELSWRSPTSTPRPSTTRAPS